MDPVIFLEKVRRPALRGLVRERLERRTAAFAGADPVSVALVLGPPGSGKTTLLSHLAESSAVPAAWYRVGSEDDDEVALTRHLGHTLGAALGRPEVIEAAAAGRIADLVRALDTPTVGAAQLVVDDLHEITGTPAERALESFLTLRPRRIRVTLGSRRPPRMNTSRLLVSGELMQLDGEDLRFRSWEVEDLFRACYGAPLSPEAAAALTRRTGGWAAGLQLFSLATAHLTQVERERAVEGLSGRSQLIRSYLARNVLDGLDPGRRRFLLLTATLGVLTGDLCDDLLHTGGSAAVLAELEREQFFTTTTDGGLTYHYHQVLQTHLEVGLVDELGGRAARELYFRSAELLEQAGRPAPAIRAYARAEDWGSVARLLKPDTPPVRGDEALWGVLSLPGAPTDDPSLVLAGARRLSRDGQLAEAVAAFRQAERLLDDPEFRRRCSVERQAAAVWLPHADLPPSPGAESAAPEERLLTVSLELRRLTTQVHDPEPTARPLVRGLSRLFAGDVVGALAQLRDGDTPSDPPTGSWEPLAEQLLARMSELLLAPDDLAAGHLEEIVLSADFGGWPWLSRMARGIQTAMLLLTTPAPWRVSAAGELVDELERRGDRWTACVTALAIAAVAVQIDEPELALTSLQRVDEGATTLGAPVLHAWAEVLRTAVELRRGAPGAEREAARAVRAARALGLTGDGVTVRHARPRPGAVGGIEPAPTVELRCLGGFSLAVAGVELGWRELRPRVRSLLMLLAVNHGHQLHRERLVDELWPDATLASGVRSLQVAVSAIRQCLAAGGIGEDALRRHGDAYALQVTGITDQLADFERLARLAGSQHGPSALASRLAALDCYAGDLLPEVGPAEWVVEERTRLRLLAAAVAGEAAHDALALGELRTALAAARRSVLLDPYHDPSWLLLVTVNERLGDPSAAAVARREHARVWADLGLVAPER